MQVVQTSDIAMAASVASKIYRINYVNVMHKLNEARTEGFAFARLSDNVTMLFYAAIPSGQETPVYRITVDAPR